MSELMLVFRLVLSTLMRMLMILSKYHTRKHEALKHRNPLQIKSRPERDQIKRRLST
jgi:hypothetical protein